MHPLKTKPDVIVYRGNYPGWPWVERTAKGGLVCVFRDDGVHGFSASGKVLFTQSRDGGRTWEAARTVVADEGVDDRNAAIGEMPGGKLLVCYNMYTRDLVSRPMVTASTDGGATWGRPALIADLDARTRGAPLALTSGDILIPIYKAPGNGSVAALSQDDGRTWRLFPVPDTAGFVGDEWVALEVEPGRVVGLFRNNVAGSDGFFWKSESRDAGRTWAKPIKTNVQSARHPSPPHLGLHGKTPILTYADRRMVSVSMAISGDPDLVQWDVDHRILCYQYRPDGQSILDASYPVSVPAGPHGRFVVDYEIRDEGKWISGYFVDLPQGWR